MGSDGETVAEHRQAADGLVLGRLVLKHVPVLGKLAVLHADDVGGDPGRWATVSGEAPMRDHIVAFREDKMIFVFQGVGQCADQVEQTVTAGRDVRAVLNVAIGPEALGGGVVPLVEERIESFEDERLVLRGGGLGHDDSPYSVGRNSNAFRLQGWVIGITRWSGTVDGRPVDLGQWRSGLESLDQVWI